MKCGTLLRGTRLLESCWRACQCQGNRHSHWFWLLSRRSKGGMELLDLDPILHTHWCAWYFMDFHYVMIDSGLTVLPFVSYYSLISVHFIFRANLPITSATLLDNWGEPTWWLSLIAFTYELRANAGSPGISPPLTPSKKKYNITSSRIGQTYLSEVQVHGPC